ncbi:hypothetical protein [Arthrobacter sp. Helios]|uniref:NACHT domain-containing protein n=1 Tax=Arthrobacter sp. Helios TaxID=2828862 RepID=UPI00204C724F|nr:hypothetical protein [Arthrobacter sp. Helios]UPO76839.1 hypothetical protein ArtHe_16180 [Arthrobacter sp. Helios]
MAQNLDPEKDRLVIVAGSLSAPMKNLQAVLLREKTDQPGPPNQAERDALDYLNGKLNGLDPNQRVMVLKCAVICELAVEEPSFSDAVNAINGLRLVVAGGSYNEARAAWMELLHAAGRLARIRSGNGLDSWLRELRSSGVQIRTTGSTTAAELERTSQAMERYRERLMREGLSMDLRGLGASLQPVALEVAEADVRVVGAADERGGGTELLWAFLRRGRVVLTGLPGGGKSIALRTLAAQLYTLPGAPIPIRISLRDLALHSAGLSFRDRLLDLAVKDDAAEDRETVKGHLDHLLSVGGVAVIMDALDETYSQRDAIIMQIDSFIASVHENVDAILSTRDVAYASASTLGWSELMLKPPAHIEHTVEAVLSAYSQKQDGLAEEEVSDWVETRRLWVMDALRNDPTLKETPLVPVLLTILAATKDLEVLPSTRAHVLADIAKQVVTTFEAGRFLDNELGRFTNPELRVLAFRSFAVIAFALMRSEGSTPKNVLVRELSMDIGSHWNFSSGHSEVAAVEMIRFFDECGFFIIRGNTETVESRIILFTEIGDALSAINLKDSEIVSWMDERIQNGQVESVVLATCLDERAAVALGELASGSPRLEILAAAVQAQRQGARLSELHVQSICARLMELMEEGGVLGWGAWIQLRRMPLVAELRTDIEQRVDSYDETSQTLILAELALRFDDQETLCQNPDVLLKLLSMRNPPVSLDDRPSRGSFDAVAWLAKRPLDKLQEEAAKVLVGKVPEAAMQALQLAKTGPRGIAATMRRILEDAGHPVDELSREGLLGVMIPRNFRRVLEMADEKKILQILASNEQSMLTYVQRTRMTEIGEFLEIMKLNDGSSAYLFDERVDLHKVIALTLVLYSFDPKVVASQANLMLEQMQIRAGLGGYYSLFELADPHRSPNWGAVVDQAEAVAVLREMLTLGRAHVIFVAEALWEAPIGDIAAPMLREALPKLVSSPFHLEWAAHTLSSLEGPEPGVWAGSEDPVLRGVRAAWCDLGADGLLEKEHLALLGDSDDLVRAVAVGRAIDLDPFNLSDVLRRIRDSPAKQWTCSSCRTVNPIELSVCGKHKCFRAAPQSMAKMASYEPPPVG